MRLGQGNLAGAEDAFQQALKIWRQLADQNLSNTGCQQDLAVSLENLGSLYLHQGNLPVAEQSLQQALVIRQRLVAQDSTKPTGRGRWRAALPPWETCDCVGGI